MLMTNLLSPAAPPTAGSSSNRLEARDEFHAYQRDLLTLSLPTEPDVQQQDAGDHELSAILAQIRELEEFESEQLAKQLQASFEQEAHGKDVAMGGFDKEAWHAFYTRDSEEHDLAMARQFALDELGSHFAAEAADRALAERLALEWELQDRPFSNSPPRVRKSSEMSLTPDNFADRQKRDESKPDTMLQEHRWLFSRPRQCSGCFRTIELPHGDIQFPSSTPPYSYELLRLLHVPCSRCKTNHCRGCFKPVVCPASCKGKTAYISGSPCPVMTCCSQVRAIALYEVLSAFDREVIKERLVTEKRVMSLTSKKGKAPLGSVGPGNTGYGADRWGNLRIFGMSRPTTPQPMQRNHSAVQFDQLLTRAFRLITEVLPFSHDDPHPSTGPLLGLSQLPAVLRMLLRNDSLTDWFDRSNLYTTMLALLKKMGSTPMGVGVLARRFADRQRKSRDVGLGDWMRDRTIEWESTTGQPLIEHLTKLTTPCHAFLKGASTLKEYHAEEDTPEVHGAKGMCTNIVDIKDSIDKALGSLGPQAQVDQSNQEQEVKQVQVNGKHRRQPVDTKLKEALIVKAYSAAHSSLSFAYVTLYPYNNYNYAAHTQRTQNGTRKPSDRLHMVKELASMSTCLPEGIWVRVDDVRPDVLKILIAGPIGTPYANGLFAFDCFLPIEYPRIPPLVHLRTTGGGSVGFNPNLYACGKVCLSLLGTWHGRPEEGWNMGGSGRSTLLQVLVSIQSMIFVEAPWFNEPGRGTVDFKSASSLNYNRTLRFQTLKWAILDWMRPEEQHGIWGDVIASHFLIKKNEITKQVSQWAQQDPKIRATGESSFPDFVTDLQKGFTRLEAWDKQFGS